MKFRNGLALVALLVLPQQAFGKDKPPPPEPVQAPNWAEVRVQSENALKAILIDPSSAQIAWAGGFRWGYFKPILQGKKWGWVGCGFVNARNRFGGYVGSTGFVVVYDGGVTYVGMDDANFPLIGQSCNQSRFPKPQPELLASSAQSATGGGSIADELAKLAKLKAEGAITEAEFLAAKAKLFGQ